MSALSMLPEEVADRELRLRCVELADGRGLDEARRIYEFVTGASEETPLARIRAALEDLECGGAI